MTQDTFEDVSFAASVVLGLSEMAGLSIKNVTEQIGCDRLKSIQNFAFIDMALPLTDTILDIAQQTEIPCRYEEPQHEEAELREIGEKIAELVGNLSPQEGSEAMALCIILLTDADGFLRKIGPKGKIAHQE